jgi:LEA14-like dessication related protein
MNPRSQSALCQTQSAVARQFSAFALAILAFGLQACAGLSPGYETPTVTVSSFKALPSEGVMPAFAIGLRVTNPNREALKLQGVAYTISLDGYEVIKGVGNELPVIEGYGQDEFTLTASANLFAGIRLITDLLNSNKDTFTYELEAKLDTGTFRPAIRVKDSGKINLGGAVSP